MSSQYTVLELRTGRDAEHTPETAVQFFATLPKLKQQWWYRLVKKSETISFELLLQNQTIYFLCYVPTRLVEYISSLLQSSYQEIMITPLEGDPLEFFNFHHEGAHPYAEQQSQYLQLGTLRLKRNEMLPLKDYRNFKEVDPLATVLATMSKGSMFDQVAVQFVLQNDGDRWKKRTTSSPSADGSTTPSEGKSSLSQKKTESGGLSTSIRVAVSSDSPERARLLLDTITSAFQSITQSDGNTLVLRRPYVFKGQFLRDFHNRNPRFIGRQHLSLEELATLFHLPNKKLSHIPNIAWGKNLLGEPPENLPILTRDMDPELKKSINAFGRVNYKNQSVVYGLKRADRRRHMYVIGKTGTGKSTLLANMAINDLKNNEGLCVIDPHGDLVETMLNYIPSHRINDVVYFDPGDPERTVRINLFEGESIVHRELIASGIVSIFHKLYAYSWGPRLEYILRNSLLTLLKSDTSRLSDILDMLTDARFRERVVSKLDDPILKNFWVNEFDQMQPRQRTEAIAPILNKVGQFVSSPMVRDVVNANKSSFSIEEIMNEGKILLVNLSQGRLGEDNSTLLGAMLITKIQLAAMARVHTPEEERRDFYLYVDEFQNFATSSFNKILSEARKYRLNLILANQYIAQIEEEVQKAIFGNCGSIVSFVMGADDASAFSKEYGELYSTEDLVSLGRYQILNKVAIDNIISRPFPAHTLNLAKSVNQNKDKVLRVSRERYARKKEG